MDDFPQNLFRYAYGFAEPYDAEIIYSDKKGIRVSEV